MRIETAAWHLGLLDGVGFVISVWAAGALLLLGVAYVAGLRRLLRHPHAARHRWRAVYLGSAVLLMVALTGPPLGEILEERLATHMVQHVAIVVLVAPLLALAAPGQALLAGLPGGLRSGAVRIGRRLPLASVALPQVAWTAHIAALWLWHLPAAYDAAVRNESVHLAEHLSFLLTAWLFWWNVVNAGRRRLSGPAAALYVAAAVPPGAALGAVLTFPDRILYPAQAAAASSVGADPLLDQRIGGLVMWIPLDLAYLTLAVWLFHRWLARSERERPAESALPVDARTREVVR
jgi:putative membrane protein